MSMNNAESSEPTLDISLLEGLVALQIEGQPDVIAEISGLFIEEASKRIADAEAALASGDAILLRRSAHTIRGACGMLGAQRLATLAGTLEAAAETKRDGLAEMVKDLAEEFDQVRTLLRPYLAGHEERTR